MKDFINFINHHFLFVLVWLLILFYILIVFFINLFNKISFVNCNKVVYLLNKHDAVIFDVRSFDEYVLEHFPKSIYIDINDLNDNNFNILRKHRSKPIILVCNTGSLSFSLAKRFKKNGFLNIYILDGGISAWKNENLPLINK
ncbi:rhodanese-like domain-containing protein [Candidatus Purcelliella pentastirinorum]|uniref:Rhodanese-like domain-containing protein n=1 Tax=Candidatus Purcelliella pentastirinorum TaxID=472834 RepID=A0AAX3NA74_9ENTR|nr:rhodanese-like domain-containing protein [Candidatus Purcelliella pentastirinorum]WDI78426.1 rhodanese-like domain-containing protein [Candidatus Purcelliella pentastirinorum]WDR80545.1 rhodanese-like domain-containing protein [Candidatus Purcelliella pentastirinorum]